MTPLIIVINSQKKLNFFKYSLKTAKAIALDTEFTRRITYYSKLSTIQVCIQENIAFIADYLLHPNFTMEVLSTIYESNAVKVFHAAQNDLEIFYNLMNKLPTNIFDTQIAFLALSSENPISYAKLIEKLFEIKINKNCRLSNWETRPFSYEQLKYASLDVILLYKAYFVVHKLLHQKNRAGYITEKINILTNESTYKFNVLNIIKKFIDREHIKNQYPLLASILVWREKTAQTQDIPKQHILTDEHIKQILNNTLSVERLYSTNKFFTPKTWNFIQKKLVLYSQYNKTFKKTHNPILLSKACNLLNIASIEENVNKELICTKKELKQFLIFFANTPYYYKILENKELKKFFVDWRYNIFTKKLLHLITTN